MSAAAQRELDALHRLLDETDKAPDPAGRVNRLREFMARSAELIGAHPEAAANGDLWVSRGAVAIELDYPFDGWLAGRQMGVQGIADRNGPEVRGIMARLEDRGWLAEQGPWRMVVEVEGRQCPMMRSPRRPWGKWTWEKIHTAAEEGDAEAQHFLGECYMRGVEWPGIAEDRAEAVKWFRKAAAQGHAEAQNGLGRCCLEAGDEAQAVMWYRKAAEQGNADAQNILGSYYGDGGRVPKNETEAVRWYRKAADQGNANAKENLKRLSH